jgi:RNA-directed DNA polymerase
MWWFATLLFLLGFSALDVIVKSTGGWLAYYAVPMSGSAITAFRQQVIERWRRAIRRRSQRHRLTWLRMKTIGDRYPPRPRILHPWPEQRFLVDHPR